jgi:Domain of unknown function (DUF4249)
MLMLTSACIEQVDLSKINGPTSGRLVVEGEITNQKKAHIVKLTRTNVAIPDSPAEGVSNCIVTISDDSYTYTLTEVDTLPGTYATADTIQGQIGKTYTLTIKSADQIYTASSTMVPVEPFTPESEIFKAPNRVGNPVPDNLVIYEVQFPKVRYGTTKPAKIESYAIDPTDSTPRMARYYEFPGIDPQGFLLNFQGQNQTIMITEGTQITQYKYSLTNDHFKFMQSVYSQTDFKGGLFDRIAANAPTNVSNGGLGFFGASAVITRSLMFERELLK